jgi:hypothetical protein
MNGLIKVFYPLVDEETLISFKVIIKSDSSFIAYRLPFD